MVKYFRDFSGDTLDELVGIEAVGGSGSGKTFTLEAIMSLLWYLGWKIIVLGEDRYFECLALMRPTEIPSHLQFCKKIGLTEDKMKLPVEYWIPLSFNISYDNPFKGSIKDGEIPENFHLYTVPIQSLGEREMVRILTSDSISNQGYTVIADAIAEMKDSDSLTRAMNVISDKVDDKLHKGRIGENDIDIIMFAQIKQSATSAIKVLNQMGSIGVFSSKDFPENIEKHMEEIISNNNISVFNFHHIDLLGEDRLKMGLNYKLTKLIRQTNNAMKHRRKIAVFVNDASKYYPNGKTATDVAQKLLSSYCETEITEARKAGIRWCYSHQDPRMLHPVVRGQCQFKMFFRSYIERSELSNHYGLRDGILDNLSQLATGKFYLQAAGFRTSSHFGDKVMVKREGHFDATKGNAYYAKGLKGLAIVEERKEALKEEWRRSNTTLGLKRAYLAQEAQKRYKLDGFGKAMNLPVLIERMSVGVWYREKQLRMITGLEQPSVQGANKQGIEKGFLQVKEDEDETGKMQKFYAITEKAEALKAKYPAIYGSPEAIRKPDLEPVEEPNSGVSDDNK